MKRNSVLSALVLGACVLAGCGGDDASPSTTTLPASTTTTTVAIQGSDEGVVVAGLLLELGDIDLALAEGLVTPDEVDQAVRVIEDGTMEEISLRVFD